MLFKGMFNWYGEVHVLYTRANNKDIAFNNFITQISKILERSRSIINIYFLNKEIENWSIKREFIDKANAKSLGGRNDWTSPNKNAL